VFDQIAICPQAQTHLLRVILWYRLKQPNSLLHGALTPFYRAWMRFGLIAGYVNTRIIMFMLYYLIFAPLGIIMSLVGRDALLRKTGDTTQDSYRVTSSQRDADHFERPY